MGQAAYLVHGQRVSYKQLRHDGIHGCLLAQQPVHAHAMWLGSWLLHFIICLPAA